MTQSILITGGAGFIGSHLADDLLARGHRVRVLDNLTPQVHGASGRPPAYLSRDVEVIEGDVRDREAVKHALRGIDSVFHFAAAVGVGQSMYEIEKYTSVNALGTAALLETFVEDCRPQRLVVASSMSVYGEGLYRAPDGSATTAPERSLDQLREGRWEVEDAAGRRLEPLPTPEWKRPSLSSVYALTKYDQERLCLMIGRSYGIPTVALRFFNVYGTRQALSNPYTGVLAIFTSRYLNGRPPLIFEDGNQKRDFVSVHDVVQACRLALDAPGAVDRVLNVGSGKEVTVREVAERIGKVFGKREVEPRVIGKYRMGDIRHCFADIGRARELLGYEPRIDFEEGLAELAGWLEGQRAEDLLDSANAELGRRGLTV